MISQSYYHTAKRTFFWLFYNLVAKHLPRSTVPYSLGAKRVRAFACRHLLRSCGKNINVEPKVTFVFMSQTQLGDNSGIGIRSHVESAVIGRDVMIGPELMLLSGTKGFDRLEIPMTQQVSYENRPVVIEDNVWIGARVIILPGRRIGKGAIVGAGAVITKDVEPFSIVGGNPAQVIGSRKSSAKDARHLSTNH
jgi:maltose O-acetyltransferase